MKLRWTRRAKDDLVEISRYIAEDKPDVAQRWVRRLVSSARQAAETPSAGRRVPELMREDIREVLVRSYRIVYKADREAVWIVTVFEGHRLLPRDIVETLGSRNNPSPR
jgi:plasmid stabilization system protein ParE